MKKMIEERVFLHNIHVLFILIVSVRVLADKMCSEGVHANEIVLLPKLLVLLVWVITPNKVVQQDFKLAKIMMAIM